MGNLFVWGIIAATISGFLAFATNLYSKPSGFAVGIISGVAFAFGVIATRIQLF